ncbi:hypothetical protein MMC06_000633 [Schaereria dolodes]|nr:hypothetical protein [Schaereria dolodes]
MKTSCITVLALASSLMDTIAHPTIDFAVEKRAADPVALVSSLHSAVSVYTAKINTTAASIHSTSSASQKSAAEASVQGDVNAITIAINAATVEVKALKKVKPATLGIAAPLTTALSNLLLALEVVVNDLLAVVQELVDGLLTGLSAALAGLVL